MFAQSDGKQVCIDDAQMLIAFDTVNYHFHTLMCICFQAVQFLYRSKGSDARSTTGKVTVVSSK